jgi:hypothetical protein
LGAPPLALSTQVNSGIRVRQEPHAAGSAWYADRQV